MLQTHCLGRKDQNLPWQILFVYLCVITVVMLASWSYLVVVVHLDHVPLAIAHAPLDVRRHSRLRLACGGKRSGGKVSTPSSDSVSFFRS